MSRNLKVPRILETKYCMQLDTFLRQRIIARALLNIEEGAANGSAERRGHTGSGPTSHELAFRVVIAEIVKTFQVCPHSSRLALTDSTADNGTCSTIEGLSIVLNNANILCKELEVFIHTRMDHWTLFADRHATHDARDNAEHFRHQGFDTQ